MTKNESSLTERQRVARENLWALFFVVVVLSSIAPIGYGVEYVIRYVMSNPQYGTELGDLFDFSFIDHTIIGIFSILVTYILWVALRIFHDTVMAAIGR